jgi:tRNA-Thr(GGU) m(6)t(6)A37 methyltransferase TsaA
MEADRERMITVLDYWLEHQRGHREENTKWITMSKDLGFPDIAAQFARAVEEADGQVHRIEHLRERLLSETVPASHPPHGHTAGIPHQHIQLHRIGTIRTPYPAGTRWSDMQEEGDCTILLDARYADGLDRLSEFRYLYVIFFMDRTEEVSLTATPPRGGGISVGVFASRSPARPNHVGLCVTPLRSIDGAVITTGRIDAWDETPLIDLKPYIRRIDCRSDADDGWLKDSH